VENNKKWRSGMRVRSQFIFYEDLHTKKEKNGGAPAAA
jgi:hypothetical protein